MTTGAGWRIGVIGGAGWLGSAIADSLLASGLIAAEDLSLSYRSKHPDRFDGACWTTDNQALVDRSDIIILSVRPADWADLRIDAAGKLVISVMAGIRLEALCERHKTGRVIRALPNAAAEVQKSYTPWIGTEDVDAVDKSAVAAIFDACGIQDEVKTEGDIDYLTGLTGSGPAFPAVLAAAMMADAINRGLDQRIACRAVNALMVGAGRLLELRDDCPTETVRTFLDYRGTTAAAIEEMRRAGIDAAVARALEAAFQKSVSMGDKS